MNCKCCECKCNSRTVKMIKTVITPRPPIQEPIDEDCQNLLEEIKKVLHFHESHNIMTEQPKGVMPVSVARELLKRLEESK